MKLRNLFLVLLITAGLFVVGCGSDDDDDDTTSAAAGTVTGVAATGAALANATVNVYNSAGTLVGTGTTDSNGALSVSVSSTDTVYVIVISDGTNTVSTVGDGSGEAVTPLTTIVMMSLLKIDYATLTSGGFTSAIASNSGNLTAANIATVGNQVLAMLGLSGIDIFASSGLTIGGAGYDSLLDAVGTVFTSLSAFLSNFSTTSDTLVSTVTAAQLTQVVAAADLTGTGVTLDPDSAKNPYFTLNTNVVQVGSTVRQIGVPVNGTATVATPAPTFTAGSSPAISMTFANQFVFSSTSATMTLVVSDSASSRTATVTMSVNVSSDGTDTTVTVPAQSNISANVTYEDGTSATVTFSNTTADGPVTSSGNTVTLDPANLRSKIESKLDSISGIVDVEEAGTYTYTVTLSGIPVAHVADDGTYTAFTAVTGSFVVQ